MITIQELLATSSIAGDRLTINSNFLLMENEINNLEDTFNINTVTGAMDISTASSGQLKAKSGYFNSLTLPASGTPSVSVYGTGASAGNASFSGTITGANITISGTGAFTTLNATGASTLNTASISGLVISYDELQNGSTGIFTDKNTDAASGSSAFATLSAGGGGVTGTFSNPYVLSGQESIIFANCAYVSGATADASNSTGFYIQVTGASGATASELPAGYKISIINTSPTGGIIGTGITGPSSTGYYYTGFSTTNGQYTSTGIVTPSNHPYRSVMSLLWEPRIGSGDSVQKGSWVLLGSSNITTF